MAFEIRTPLLKLSSELLLVVMKKPNTNTAKVIRFSDSLTKFVGEQLKAGFSRKSAPTKAADALTRRWSELGLAAQIEVVNLAKELGCSDLLEEAVGPLPSPEAQIAPVRPEPMF